MMKKVFIGLGIVVVLLIAAAFIVPSLIPLDTYKAEIATQVEEATGRKFKIDGDMSLSILPRLVIEAEKVSLANAKGAKTPNMMQLNKLQIQLALIPLLSREIVVDRFVLVDPVINLEIDKSGRPNWELGPAKGAAPPQQAKGGKAPAASSGGDTGIGGVKLDDVRLVNGRLTYTDQKTGQTQIVKDINMTLALPDVASKLRADGALAWNGEKIEIKIGLETPKILLAGKPAKIEMVVDSKPVRLSYKGNLTSGKAMAAAGAVDLNVPSVRMLATWAGQPLKAPGTGFGPLTIKGNLKMAGPRIAFENAEIGFDKIAGKGLFRVNTGGARPAITAKLTLGMLDLNPYMPPQEKDDGKGGAAPAASAPAGKKAGWSDEPIDVSGLKAVDANLDLKVEGIAVQKLRIGKTALGVTLKAGRLAANLSEMALYGGKGTALIKIDGAGRMPRIENTLKLAGVDAAPFLKDAAGFDRVEGKANADVAVKTVGLSQKQMVSALGGNAKVTFLDGAIRGINLAAMIRNVGTAFTQGGSDDKQKTDFAELSGTYQIVKGIVTNKDLLLKSPLLRLNGAGTVDLPQRSMKYRVTPKVISSIKGQGGRDEAKGISVPVVIEGPWDKLSYRPDLTSAVQDKLKEGLKDPGSLLKSLGKPKNDDGSGGGIGKPKDVLKRLFK